MTRLDGAVVSTGTIRDARANADIPIEIRDHIGAGRVTWAKIDQRWAIIHADGDDRSAVDTRAVAWP